MSMLLDLGQVVEHARPHLGGRLPLFTELPRTTRPFATLATR